MELTKDADKPVCILYKSYLEKRKVGFSKGRAREFGGFDHIHDDLCPLWLLEDVVDTCRELSRAGILICKWGDNIAYQIYFSDLGIIYMENRFKNGLLEISDFISKFIP